MYLVEGYILDNFGLVVTSEVSLTLGVLIVGNTLHSANQLSFLEPGSPFDSDNLDL